MRAKTTPKHGSVDRFGAPKPPPRPAAAVPTISARVVSRTPAAKAAQTAAPPPSMITSASHQKLERLLDQALTHADAHKQALRYHAARHFWHRGRLAGRGRWAAALVVLVALIIGVFAAWEKIPAVSVKLAGARAHISAATPSYAPDGFRPAGPAKNDSGAVVIKYESSGDSSQSYTITQSESNLTGNSVAQSVLPKGATVQTSQVEGNTVYIYGSGNNAAWINNGILYKIDDHAQLSSDALINIVEGLNP